MVVLRGQAKHTRLRRVLKGKSAPGPQSVLGWGATPPATIISAGWFWLNALELMAVPSIIQMQCQPVSKPALYSSALTGPSAFL